MYPIFSLNNFANLRTKLIHSNDWRFNSDALSDFVLTAKQIYFTYKQFKAKVKMLKSQNVSAFK